MQFVLTTSHRYWWPVTVKVPHPDAERAGEMMEMSFKVLFDSLPRAEQEQISEQLKGTDGTVDAARVIDADLKRVVLDWDDVVAADGKPLDFTAETFEQLLAITWYRIALYRAWAASIAGNAARLGN